MIEEGLQGLDELSVIDEATLGAAQNLEDPRGSWGRTVAQLGVERDTGAFGKEVS
jgi:hypothetical protein